MNDFLPLVFWGAVALVAYVYIGYPCTLALLPPSRRTAATGELPRVSVLIAAYNEAASIEATIRNKLALNYPRDLLELIVVSDGSTDATDDIARSFGESAVRYLRQEPRQGKTAALNMAREVATGDILVFSDANSMFDREAIGHLVRRFRDPQVGYVTGKLIYLNPGESASAATCGAYMRYENWIRTLETRVGSVVGVNGGVDAVRASLFRPMRPDHLPDFVLPLRIVERRFRVVFEPKALSFEEALADASDEMRMRIRVSLRALRSLIEFRSLLRPARSGLFALQLFVHKWLRYFVFVPLGFAFCANALLLGHPLYGALFALQVVFYLAAAAGYLFRTKPWARLFAAPTFFAVVNAACFVAIVRLLRGETQTKWQPRGGDRPARQVPRSTGGPLMRV